MQWKENKKVQYVAAKKVYSGASKVGTLHLSRITAHCTYLLNSVTIALHIYQHSTAMRLLHCVVFLICSFVFSLENETNFPTETLLSIYKSYNEKPGLDHYYNYGPAYDENLGQIRSNAIKNNKTKVTYAFC